MNHRDEPHRDASGQDMSSDQARHHDPGKQDISPARPPRRDLIYAVPVEVRLVDGRRAVVRHPPFDGRVQAVAGGKRRGWAVVVALDDLSQHSRIALARADVRRRVEVRVRCCSRRSCPRVIRGWLTQRNTVETTDGKVICSLADVFNGRCPEHRTR